MVTREERRGWRRRMRVELVWQAEHLSNPASSEGLQLSHWEDTGSQQSRIPQVFISLAAH